MPTTISLKQGERMWLTFTYKDTTTGAARDVSGATFSFAAKANKSDDTTAVSIEDKAFDKTDAENGIILCLLDTSSLQAGTRYIGEVCASWGTGAEIIKSDDIFIEILQPVVIEILQPEA